MLARGLIGILIVALMLLLILHWVRLRRSHLLDGFVDGAGAGTGIDVAAYLAALDEYNGFFKGGGFRTCKIVGTADRFCGAYGGRAGDNYTYAPPRFQGAAGFNQRIEEFNQVYGAVANPVSISAVPGPAVEDWAPLTVERGAKYTSGILFTFYCARPAAAENFVTAPATGLETLLRRLTTLSVREGDTLSPTYVTLLGISAGGGKESYRFRKVFSDMRADNPVGLRNVLGIRREFEQGPELYVAGSAVASSAIRNVAGSAWESSEELLQVMLTVRSQEDLNARLMAVPSAGVGAGAGAGAGVGTGVGAGTIRQVAGQIAIPTVTYFEDAWMRNRALFDRMYKAIENPSAAMRSYYQSARIAQGDSYEKTALRFVELDKRILAGATVNGKVQPDKLRRADGVSYKFEVPYPYDPQFQIFGADVEEPSLPAIDLKCFKVTPGLQRIKAYFTQRPYEDLRTTNTEVFGRIRANFCASFGYVSQETLERCGCDGCCIPIAYVPQTAKSTRATTVDDRSAELLSAGGDNCIRFNGIKPFRVVQKTVGAGVCEGWEDAGLTPGMSTAAKQMQMHSSQFMSSVARGWKMFEARAPLVMGFTGSGGGGGDAAGCSLPLGSIKRAPMKIVKYNRMNC